MHKAEIQAALKMAGVSQAALAEECGVTPTTVSDVIAGKRWSQAVAERIASRTGYSIQALWPERFVTSERIAQAAPGVAKDSRPSGLNEEEWAIVMLFRGLSSAQREQARAMLTVIGLGLQFGGLSVAATSGGVAAGRNVSIGKGSARKK